ncbi:MAG: hypothetical protein GX660_01055 [Clostridiaceae bacterium]|nr:hypothetical protein [Clostridiaceae bacterium]
MDYPMDEDFLFVPKEPTEEQSRIADLICNLTGVNRDRLLKCICAYGIDKVLRSPEVLCVSIQDQQKIAELGELLLYMKEIK